jgi:hypothetical protein
MSARTLVSTFSQLRNKGPQLTLVYIRIRNPVPVDKLTSRTERLRVGLLRFISVTYRRRIQITGDP